MLAANPRWQGRAAHHASSLPDDDHHHRVLDHHGVRGGVGECDADGNCVYHASKR